MGLFACSPLYTAYGGFTPDMTIYWINMVCYLVKVKLFAGAHKIALRTGHHALCISGAIAAIPASLALDLFTYNNRRHLGQPSIL